MSGAVRGVVEKMKPAKLIAPMLARFMATDRTFAKMRRANQAPVVGKG